MSAPLPRGVDADTDPERFPLITLDGQGLMAALYHWERVMGTPWALTPGVAGADALEAIVKGVRTYRAAWKQAPGQPYSRASEAPYRAGMFDVRDDCTAPYLHAYDLTRARPTAAGVTMVSPWALRPGPKEFDKGEAGWWLVDVAPWCWPDFPDPAGYNRRWEPGASRWLSTPTLTLLRQLEEQGVHGGFTVERSYTGQGRPLFREWNARLETLIRGADTDELRACAKAAGRETLGLLNSSTYQIYRPDWHFQIIAQERTNLFRKMWKVYGEEARTPLAIETDCVWYGSHDPDGVIDAPLCFTLGDRPGGFKVQKTVGPR